jgi:hypothetical protein
MWINLRFRLNLVWNRTLGCCHRTRF